MRKRRRKKWRVEGATEEEVDKVGRGGEDKDKEEEEDEGRE